MMEYNRQKMNHFAVHLNTVRHLHWLKKKALNISQTSAKITWSPSIQACSPSKLFSKLQSGYSL